MRSRKGGSADRGSLRDGFRGAFRALDLLACLYERGGKRGPGMYPTGLRGDPRVPRIRRAYLTFVFLRDPGRARRDGRDRLGWVGGVRDFVWQRARFARGGRRRCLRPYRPLLTHHGRRGRFAILDRGLRLGRRGARAGSAVRGCAFVGIFRGDVVLAGGGGARPQILGHTVLNWTLRYVEA